MMIKNMKLKCAIIVMIIAVLSSQSWTQDHDLVMQEAPDITSDFLPNCKSPDIQVNAPFGSTGEDTILHGRTHQIYARFLVNGLSDQFIPPDSPVTIEFHYRPATLGIAPPPDIEDLSWELIDTIDVDGMYTTDIYLGPGSIWPDDYFGMMSLPPENLSIDWEAPTSGDYFHIRADVIHPAGYTDINPDDNKAISLYEAITQPHDIDIVLVHDVSGSMLYYTTDDLISYIDHAIEMASALVASMPETDRLAIVAFGGCLPDGVEDIFPSSTPGTLEIMTQDMKDEAIYAIENDLIVDSISCMTPMGDGLQRAINILVAESAPESKKIILLLSDGKENSGNIQACIDGDASVCASSDILTQLQDNNIQAYTIALGPAGWEDCLGCLAVQSNGQYYAADSGVDLLDVYLEAQQAYEDDDLYKKDISYIGNDSDSYEVYFEGVDNVLYFILGWDDLEAEMDLILTSPSENEIKAKTYSGRGYIVHQVMNPEKGLWRYTVEGPEGERYLAAVRSNKVNVRMSLDVSDDGIVGRPLSIKAGLTNTSPGNAKVIATAEVPYEQSLDTAISMAVKDYLLEYRVLPVTDEDLRRNPDQGAKSIFINKILKDTSRQEKLIQRQTVEIPLEPTNDGFFDGTLSRENTQLAGKYVVTVNGSGREFNREYAKTILLKPGNVDKTKSYAEVIALDPNQTQSRYPQYVLRVYCNDSYNNLVISNKIADRLSVNLYQGEPIDEFGIGFDGTYQQIIQYKPGVPVELSVFLDGNNLPVEYHNLSGPTPTTTPTPTIPGDLGNVNGDDSIDIVDALLVAQFYVGLNPDNFDESRADTNCDEDIDIVDALLIAQYYVGLIHGFC